MAAQAGNAPNHTHTREIRTRARARAHEDAHEDAHADSPCGCTCFPPDASGSLAAASLPYMIGRSRAHNVTSSGGLFLLSFPMTFGIMSPAFLARLIITESGANLGHRQRRLAAGFGRSHHGVRRVGRVVPFGEPCLSGDEEVMPLICGVERWRQESREEKVRRGVCVCESE